MGCKEEVLKKFKEFKTTDIKNIIKQLESVKKARENRPPSKGITAEKISSLEQELLALSARVIEKEKRAMFKKKLNTYRSIITKKQMLDKARLSDRPFDGLEAVITGSEGTKVGILKARIPFEGQKDSVSTHQLVVKKDMLLNLFKDIEREHDGILRNLNNANFQDRIFLEMAELKEGGKPGYTGDADTLHMAEVFKKHYDISRNRFNELGADVKYEEGYTGAQMHDATKVRGKTLFRGKDRPKQNMQEWMRDQMEWLDHERTFEDSDPVEFLTNVYENITTGLHGIHENIKDIPANVASSASRFERKRVLHYKSAEAALANNKKYGRMSPFEALVMGLERRADAIGLIERMGLNAEKNFDEVIEIVASESRKIDGKFKEPLTKFQQQALKNRFAAVSGQDRIIESPTLAYISSTIRAINNMVSLGLAMITSFNDVAFSANQAKYNGIGYLDAYHDIFTRLSRLKLDKAEKAVAMELLGTGFDHAKSVVNRYASGDFVFGGMSKLQDIFFKVNRLQWWTDFVKEINAVMLSNHIGNNLSKTFDNLDVNFQNSLFAHGITPEEWKIMGHGKMKMDNGKTFFTPLAIDDIADEIFGTVNKKNLRDKLSGYFIENSNAAVPTPGAKERAILRRGQKAGSPIGVAIELFAQFKMFPLTIMTKVWPKMLQMGVPGSIHLIGMSLLFGYASLSIKDMVKGHTPRSPSKLKTWLDSFVNGGAGAVYGDFIFQDFNIYGRGLTETIGGPTVSKLADLARIKSSVFAGSPAAASQSMRFFMNNIPFSNLPFTKWATDYMFMWYIQESLNPGSLDRQITNLQEQRGQRPLLKTKRTPTGVF